MMKKWINFVFLLTIVFGLKAQNSYVVGFLPHYRFDYVDDINFDAITHLNLAFANPDMEGNLSFENAPIAYTINKAIDNDVKVFISLAGGYLKPEWDLAWQSLMKEENRSEFIHKIVKYVKNNNADGVDLDLEWQYVTPLYSPFAIELADSLHAHNYDFSASLPGTYRYPEISDEALDAFDWVNMMVYDLTGPWAPGNPGPHSPFSFAENSLFYWKLQGLDESRLTLGMPFYGYDFSDPTATDTYTYRYIVSFDEAAAQLDQVDDIYYNGIPTIKAKTQYALDENLLGVMIWELGQDNYEELSLLDAINEVMNQAVSIEQAASADIKIYPNPFDSYIQVMIEKRASFRILDMQGRLVTEGELSKDLREINGNIMHPGLYMLQLNVGGKILYKKIRKI